HGRSDESANRVYGSPNRHCRITLQPRRRFSEQQREVDVGCADPAVLEYAMPKVIAVLGSALFFVIAPMMLAGIVPWWVTQWVFRQSFSALDPPRLLGVILFFVGVPGLVVSFALFGRGGGGPPAPIAPPQKLVVTGLYRYVRNPIYVAVVAVIFGQA